MIHSGRISAFMSTQHPLAKKSILQWSDLRSVKMASFDETYMMHHLIQKKLSTLGYSPKMVVHAKSWDFLLETVRLSDLVTLLPDPIIPHINQKNIIRVPIENPLKWEVVLVHPIKRHYATIEKYTKSAMLDFFINHKPIEPLRRNGSDNK